MTGRDLYDLLNNLPGWCDDYTVCFSTGDGNVCVEAGEDWYDGNYNVVLRPSQDDDYVFTVSDLMSQLHSLNHLSVYVDDGNRYRRPLSKRFGIDNRNRCVTIWLHSNRIW